MASASATESGEAKKSGGPRFGGVLRGLADAKKGLRKVSKVKKIVSEPLPPKHKVDECKPKRTILVIDFQTDWRQQFEGCALSDGCAVCVEQTVWGAIEEVAVSHTASGTQTAVHLLPSAFCSSERRVVLNPDFLLIRALPMDLHCAEFDNVLTALQFAGIPAINSLSALRMCLQRPLVYSAMLAQSKADSCELPLIPMAFFANGAKSRGGHWHLSDATLVGSSEWRPPVVAKVGGAHSGHGKMRVADSSQMCDLESILISATKQYYTVEPFIESANVDFEYRIQMIGARIRGFKRIQSESWKTHISSLIEYELDATEVAYIKCASRIFGGLHICALDVFKMKDGSDIIIELNDCAIGLMGAHEVEDESAIRDLCIEEMSKAILK